MTPMDFHRKTACHFYRVVIFTTLVACAASLHAQSSDPARLKEIIAQKNAEAAAATWGDRQMIAPLPTPPASAQGASSQPSGYTGTNNSQNNSPNFGSAGFASMAPLGNDAAPAFTPSQPDVPASVAANNSPALAAQSADQSAPAKPMPDPDSSAASTPVASPPSSATARPATVTYTAGLLTVRADDASLNQILRQFSKLTGTTISGGVVEERVFGNYGPAKPAAVLGMLLDGTGTNILLREGTQATPAELVLTPRKGGATPPGPSASIFDSPEDHRGRTQSTTLPSAQIPQPH